MLYDIKCNGLSSTDIRQISKLHVKYLETGFLSQLGAGFLFYLYQSMHQSQETVLIIAKHNDEVIAFFWNKFKADKYLVTVATIWQETK